MRRRDDRTDEGAIRALLAGRGAPEDESLVRFVAELRQVASPVKPRDDLRELFAHGLDVTDAPSMARPAPKRSKGRRMIETLVGKLAGVGLAAKIGLASAVAVAGVTGAGVSDNLPEPAQDAFNNVVGAEVEADDVELPEDVDLPEEAEFGQSVSDDARDGGVDGRDVAEEASDGRSEEGRQTAEDASEGRSENGSENGADGLETADERSGDAEGQVDTPAGPETGEERSGDAGDQADDRRQDGERP